MNKNAIFVFLTPSGLDIIENGITIVLDHHGRNSGEAFVQFSSPEAALQALQRNRNMMGHRWAACARTLDLLVIPPQSYGTLVRVCETHWSPLVFADTLRCIPVKVKKFPPGRRRGQVLGRAPTRQPRGRRPRKELHPVRAFQTTSVLADVLVKIVWGRWNQLLQSLVFSSNRKDIEWALKRFISLSPLPDYPQSSTVHLHFVHMRGIPFNASGEDIVEVREREKVEQLKCRAAFLKKLGLIKCVCVVVVFAPPRQFFSPLIVSKILLECSSNGRLNGEADVFFNCHRDAVAALNRDRKHIGKTCALQVWYNYNKIKNGAINVFFIFQGTATSSCSSTLSILPRGEPSSGKTAADAAACSQHPSPALSLITWLWTLWGWACTPDKTIFICFFCFSRTQTSTNKHSDKKPFGSLLLLWMSYSSDAVNAAGGESVESAQLLENEDKSSKNKVRFAFLDNIPLRLILAPPI